MSEQIEVIHPWVRRMVEEARSDPEGFWARAAEQLPWFRKWDRVLERQDPTFRWFVNAQTNICSNALDHHVHNGRGGRAALIYESETGERRVFTWDATGAMVKFELDPATKTMSATLNTTNFAAECTITNIKRPTVTVAKISNDDVGTFRNIKGDFVQRLI